MIRCFFIFLSFYLCLLNAQPIENNYRTGYESIRTSDLRAHLTILASDSLEGRETTYPGQKKAADYIARIFKMLKLEPIGDSGSYFQHFDVDVIRVNPETRMIADVAGIKKNYVWGKDFFAEGAKDTIVSGPVAFVGFTDTEIDSTAKAKLRGRIVFVFIGKKDFAGDTTKAATMRRVSAIRLDAGALAALMIPDAEGDATYEGAKEIIRSFGRTNGSMQMKGAPPRMRSQSVRFIVNPAIAEDVLRSSGTSLQDIRAEALKNQQLAPLFLDNVIVTIESKVIRETKQTENVLGLLPGTDPKLKAQVVAFTAHYDHLGKNKKGIIYPGADDDGSGTAAILSLAEAFSKNPLKPKRSLLFIMMVGEEKGLFGSLYYTNNPIIPLNHTIADLNIDMIGRLDSVHEARKDSNSIFVIGSDKISLELDSLLREANKESERLDLDYKYNSESDPEQYYRRSDHYNFAKNGVPIVFFFDGTHADYHKPTDTVDKILFERMMRIEHVIYNLGWKLAQFDRLLSSKPLRE